MLSHGLSRLGLLLAGCACVASVGAGVEATLVLQTDEATAGAEQADAGTERLVDGIIEGLLRVPAMSGCLVRVSAELDADVDEGTPRQPVLTVDAVRFACDGVAYCAELETYEVSTPTGEPRLVSMERAWRPEGGSVHTAFRQFAGPPPAQERNGAAEAVPNSAYRWQARVSEEACPSESLLTSYLQVVFRESDAEGYRTGHLAPPRPRVTESVDMAGLSCVRLDFAEGDVRSTVWRALDRDYKAVRTETLRTRDTEERLLIWTVDSFRPLGEDAWFPASITSRAYARPTDGEAAWRLRAYSLTAVTELTAGLPEHGVFSPRLPCGALLTETDGGVTVVGGDISPLLDSLMQGSLPPSAANPPEILGLD